MRTWTSISSHFCCRSGALESVGRKLDNRLSKAARRRKAPPPMAKVGLSSRTLRRSTSSDFRLSCSQRRCRFSIRLRTERERQHCHCRPTAQAISWLLESATTDDLGRLCSRRNSQVPDEFVRLLGSFTCDQLSAFCASRAGPEARRATWDLHAAAPPVRLARRAELQISGSNGARPMWFGCAGRVQIARSIRRFALPSSSSLAS